MHSVTAQSAKNSDVVWALIRRADVTTATLASPRIVWPHPAIQKQSRLRRHRTMLTLAFCACSTMASSPQPMGRRTSTEWQGSVNAEEGRIVIPVRARPKPDVSTMQRNTTTPLQPQDEPSMWRRLTSFSRRYVVSMDNHANVQYGVDVVIGRDCKSGKGQTLSVIADTGSSDFWVKAASSKYPTGYAINASCTAVDDGERRTFAYADGTVVQGTSFRDQITIGGVPVERALGFRVDTMSDDNRLKFDGIMGLADLNQEAHFFWILFKQYPHIPRQFQMIFSSFEEGESLIILGQDDLKKYGKEREFRYATSSSSKWEIPVLSIGLQQTGFKSKWDGFSLVDSGTSQIVLPQDVFEHVASQLTWRLSACFVKRTGLPILMCDCPRSGDLSRLPGLVVEIERQGGGSFNLCVSPQEMILQDSSSGTCMFNIAPGDRMILGQGFLRTYVTNFDVEGGRVGFAVSSQSPTELSPCTVDAAPLISLFTWLSGVILAIVSAVHAIYALMLPGPSRKHREVHVAGEDIAFDSAGNSSQRRTDASLEFPPL
eukprot:TRINITY_DN1732_c0_g1_i1.p1 TRINITY_DN1732_c0_g1~~TRINITY_DN1732_c0_g1_i1.p1  ORF type:complete len:560 (-),score=55.70 TRINITY_DN1732_c0_g1_i1:173-1804(-)